MRTNCGPGRDPLLQLATDATPAGYSKKGQGELGQIHQRNTLVRPCIKTATMEVQEQTTRESFRGKLDFYCVTRENICRLLTKPRHHEKKNL